MLAAWGRVATAQPPTFFPTNNPSNFPTLEPTTPEPTRPTNSPTFPPTLFPTGVPSNFPTLEPTTPEPTRPTASPTKSPTTWAPTGKPSTFPTRHPTTRNPTYPTNSPTFSPTLSPTTGTPTTPKPTPPTKQPTWDPTGIPSQFPTLFPTTAEPTYPTESPSNTPSVQPTQHPTSLPTVSPTTSPSMSPTAAPTRSPTPPTRSPTRGSLPGVYVMRASASACVPASSPGVAGFTLDGCQAACDADYNCWRLQFSPSLSVCSIATQESCTSFSDGSFFIYERIGAFPPTEVPSPHPTEPTLSPTVAQPTTDAPTGDLTWNPTIESDIIDEENGDGLTLGQTFLVAVGCFAAAFFMQTLNYFITRHMRGSLHQRRRYSGGNFPAVSSPRLNETAVSLDDGYSDDGDNAYYENETFGQEGDAYEEGDRFLDGFNDTPLRSPPVPHGQRDLRNLGQTESILVNI